MADPSYDFSGRRVLVTGGTRGLGLTLARAFADAGAKVVVTGRQALTGYYDADLSRFEYHQLRLTDRDSIAEVSARLGHLDVLVNNASAHIPAALDAGELQFLAHATRLGLIGPIAFTNRLRFRLGQSRQRAGGAVVNTPGTHQWFELAHEEQARGELAQLTQRLGSDWARGRVRVNTVSAVHLLPQQSGLRVQIDRNSGPLLTRTQAPRGTMRDVRNAVLFLASEGAAGVTGQDLRVSPRHDAGT